MRTPAGESASSNQLARSLATMFFTAWRALFSPTHATTEHEKVDKEKGEQALSPPKSEPKLIENPRPASEMKALGRREVYMRLMVNEHGIPMWNPRPRSLPANRRAKGVVPGDVGVIKEAGACFSYLFNIWDDAEALKTLNIPGGRDFLPPPLREIDGPDTILTKMSSLQVGDMEKRSANFTDSDPRYCDLHYMLSAGEAAILVTPFGAQKEALNNNRSIETFLKHNCRRLYELAGVGRNDQLYIVTDCVKTPSWAMATYSSQAQSLNPASLQNLRFGQRSNTGIQTYEYEWTATPSGTDAHTGPQDTSSPSDDQNQTVFVNGYRLCTFLEEDSSTQGDLSSIIVGTESTSAASEQGGRHNPSAGSPAGSSSSGSSTSRSTGGHGSQRAQLLDGFSSHLIGMVSPGECLNTFLCSSPIAQAVRSRVPDSRFGQHEVSQHTAPIPGTSLPLPRELPSKDRILGFSLIHDNIWLKKWQRVSTTTSNWDVAIMKSLRMVRKETTVVADPEFSDVISVVEKHITETDQAQRMVNIVEWQEIFSTLGCTDPALPPLASSPFPDLEVGVQDALFLAPLLCG
ncbi:hypothetical protein FA15DRAFT_518693 [Coprinopsis marcescibilis]|uniref:Uncharacterized protein n=1 Tax=Coprinopsis marcescibilis TaxID=230819 RepID=A0A5C3L2L7_COPMA|nr:hypothetical protein FA15DRAFT_518693 [Coprinopsis marcescibilis]